MRRYGKKDDCQKQIVKVLQQLGFGVIDLSSLGNNIPDLLIAKSDRTALVELKSENGKLSKGQEFFKLTWPGKCFMAKSAEEIYEKWKA